MSSLLTLALCAVASVSSTLAKPLSTSPYYAPSNRLPLGLAPLSAHEHKYGSINNSYIIMMKPGVQPQAMQNHLNFLQFAVLDDSSPTSDWGLTHLYDGHIKGYAGKFSEGILDQIRGMPEVDYVERDQIVRTQKLDKQRSAPWGLARVSHRNMLNFSNFMLYEYDNNGGAGVDVYVIDTGINIKHVEFEGRASWGKTIPQNDVDEDGNGHGTHCAGTIASKAYGVAKGANVIAVKVLGSNGSGSMSDVVAGVVFAVEAAQKKAAQAKAELAATGKTNHTGSVANMSLGGGKSPALDDAVNRAVGLGLHFAVAAGNDDQDACKYSPAAAEQAVTVGASTLQDERAYFSNHGACVDVFAPGLNIRSTWTGSPTATSTISGTSMASPHTAGMLAYLLSLYPSATFDPSVAALFPDVEFAPMEQPSVYGLVRAVLPPWVSRYLPAPALFVATAPVPPPTLTPAQLKKALLGLSSKDKLKELPPKTVNLLIFNNATSA